MKHKRKSKGSIIATNNLGNGCVVRARLIGNKIYAEIVENGRVVERFLTATINGNTLKFKPIPTTGPGDRVFIAASLGRHGRHRWRRVRPNRLTPLSDQRKLS